MKKHSVLKNYRFLAIMLGAMIAGCAVGWIWPEFGMKLKPFGTVFINMMFCVVVPLVFASISSSIACTRNRSRSGKIMGITVSTFIVTGAIAAVIIAADTVSEDAIYAMTSTIFENLPEIAEQHGKGYEASLEFAASISDVPYHPGAAKYFAEKGFDVPVK